MLLSKSCRVGLSILCLCLAAGASAAEPAESYAARFGGVKRWVLIYSYSSNSPHSYTEGHFTRNMHTRMERESGRIVIPGTEVASDTQFVIDATGKATSMLNYGHNEHEGVSRATRYDRAVGVSENHYSVEFNLEEGTYCLSIINNEIKSTYGGTETPWGRETRVWGPSEGTTHVTIPTAAPAQKIFKLPDSGRVISGSWSWEEHWNAESKEQGYDPKSRGKHQPLTGTVTWILTPDDPLDVELVVEPQMYDQWIPQGGKDESTPGNAIPIKATLQAKGGGEPPTKARRMKFQLIQRSSEPGVCLNWPVSDAKKSPDLQFVAAGNPEGSTITDEGALLTTADGDYTETTANVSAFDYGAFGTLLVTAELANGRVAVGYLKDSDLREVLLPKRSPDSNIADAWKKLAGFDGNDADDTDKQDGNDNLGDGLTAYEEYRGFMARKTHSRKSENAPNPKVKDVVVRNDVGDAAKAGLALFKKASGINVVEVSKEELNDKRLANANFATAHGGDQYGLLLRNDAIAASATAGENRPVTELNKTPIKSEMVVIDLDFAAKSYAAQAAVAKKGGEKMPYTLDEDINNTIAHEIAHGVGAPHHGKETEFAGHRKITPKMKDWKAYGVDGVQVNKPDENYELLGNIGRPGNDSSGDTTCIMCYTNFYHWTAVGPSSGPFKYYAVGLQPLGTKFCTSPKATGMNVPHASTAGTEVPGFFGDALGQGSGGAVGNCLGAMKVKDW